MAEHFILNINTVNRRTNGFLTVGMRSVNWARAVLRRAAPSVPQFDGTLSPARVQSVSLQVSNGPILETVVSDGAGYFAFNGWYPIGDDYEFLVHGDDLYEAKIFAVSTPVEHRWNGRPDIVDSTDLS